MPQEFSMKTIARIHSDFAGKFGVPRQSGLVEALEARGFTVLSSSANFIFARSNRLSGEELYRRWKENGILVRWFGQDRIRDFVRITIGSREQMEALIEQIDRLPGGR